MRKPDSLCAECEGKIFWAIVGYWLHMHTPLIDHEPKPNEG